LEGFATWRSGGKCFQQIPSNQPHKIKNMRTAITAGLVLTVAACLATTAKASLVTATIPSTTFGTIVQQGNNLANFSYVIPTGDSITSATLQLNSFLAEYNNSSGQSFVNVYLNGNLLGDFSAPYPGSNLQIAIPGADLSGLAGGTATVTWSIPTDEYFAGEEAVGFNGATLAMNVGAVPEPTTIVAGALLLIPFGVGAVRRVRGIKS
jgi:hypothetical protein